MAAQPTTLQDLRLTYFAARGCMDKIRLLLAAAAVPYTETNVSGAQFSLLQPKMEFGALPLLQLGDFRLTGAAAIFSFLAERHGMHGTGYQERAEHCMWITVADDLQQQLWDSTFMQEDDAYNDRELRARFLDAVSPKLAGVCQMLLARPRDQKYLFGDDVSSADVALYATLDSYSRELPLAFEAFSLLRGFHARVGKQAGIQAFKKSSLRY